MQAPPYDTPDPGLADPLRVPPWEDRGRYGLLNALYLTIKEVLSAPGTFFARMPTGVGMTQPFLFAIVMGALEAFCIWLWSFGNGNLPLFAHMRLLAFLSGPFVAGVRFVLSPLIAALTLLICATVVHGCLLIVGGNRLGFEATARVIAYARAAGVVAMLPICGGSLAIVWAVGIAIVGLARIHGAEPWRALVAVLVPALLVLTIGAFGLAVVAAMGLVH